MGLNLTSDLATAMEAAGTEIMSSVATLALAVEYIDQYEPHSEDIAAMQRQVEEIRWRARELQLTGMRRGGKKSDIPFERLARNC
jgi:hypothetical protein